MSGGTQVDIDLAGPELTGQQGGTGAAVSPGARGLGAARYLTDEEILGMDSPSPEGGYGELVRRDDAEPLHGDVAARRGEGAHRGARTDELADAGDADANTVGNRQAEAYPTGMPSWMAAAAADPRTGAEASALWREHQEFRAAFASPEEARAVKELLPGGVRDVLSLREATQSVERIDAALFSGDPRAQAEVVAEIARANPAAFRAMFAEAAKVLAGGSAREAGGWNQEVGGQGARRDASPEAHAIAQSRDGRSKDASVPSRNDFQAPMASVQNLSSRNTPSPQASSLESRTPNIDERGVAHDSRFTNHESRNFDPAAYAAFERATNDAVARDVRGAIADTLARVMPDGVAEGAARRIGEDIFQEVHRTLAADQALSEQVAAILSSRRFGGAEQQRVSSLLAGRARQIVAGVARRVIGEWTSSVLNTSRSKAARQAVAASRVDIAAPGGSLDSMPLRQMSPREVNYASMSDEQILGM